MAQVSIYGARNDIPRDGLMHTIAGMSAVDALLALNHITASAVLAASGAQVTSGDVLNFVLSGEFWAGTSAAPVWTLVGDPVGPGLTNVYLFLIAPQAGALPGTASALFTPIVVPGTPSSAANTVTFPPGPYEAAVDALNAPPNGAVMVGGVIIQNGGTVPFVPGTTALTATGITATFFDGFYAPLLVQIVNGMIGGAVATGVQAETQGFEEATE